MSSLPFILQAARCPTVKNLQRSVSVSGGTRRDLCASPVSHNAPCCVAQPLSSQPDLSSTSCRLRKRRRHAASRHTCILLHTTPVHPRTRRTSKCSCGGSDAQQRVCGSSRGAAGIPSGVNHTGRVGGAEHSQLNQWPSELIWMQLSALLLLRTASPPPWALNSCFATLSAAA